MNRHLIMAANSKGFVVRSVESRPDNAFGKADIITIENSTHRIHFTSNVLHGTNYCQIIKVEDLYKRRTYTAHRYFHKFIQAIAIINLFSVSFKSYVRNTVYKTCTVILAINQPNIPNTNKNALWSLLRPHRAILGGITVNYTPFKGRTVAKGDKVEVYRNLHNGKISIRDPKTKLVLGHTDTIYLADVTFKVHQKGRERVLNEKRKNVHAYAIGRYMGNPETFSGTQQLTYNPYKYKSFVNASTGQAVHSTDYAFLAKEGTILTV